MKEIIKDSQKKFSSKRVCGVGLIIILAISFILDSVGVVKVSENLFGVLAYVAGGMLAFTVGERLKKL